MFELYGSTEAAISTFRKKTDPRGSVGEVTDPNVRILDASGRECPPAEVGADGRIANYEQAVGEICRVAPDTASDSAWYSSSVSGIARWVPAPSSRQSSSAASQFERPALGLSTLPSPPETRYSEPVGAPGTGDGPAVS